MVFETAPFDHSGTSPIRFPFALPITPNIISVAPASGRPRLGAVDNGGFAAIVRPLG